MPDPNELLNLNLHEVFAERNTDKRRAAIERTYSEDVRFIDPEGEVVGWDALDDRAQRLIGSAPAEFVLEEDGPRYTSATAAALPWRFGPPGSPVARGIDILFIHDGRVNVLRTLLAPRSDS